MFNLNFGDFSLIVKEFIGFLRIQQLSYVSKGITYVYIFLISVSAFCQTSSIPRGEGSFNIPYLISNAAELTWVAERTNAGSNWSAGKYFLQIEDIDLGPDYSSGSGWIMIGTNTNAFEGYYDGGGHEILNLFIDRSGTNSVGFFGKINNGTVVNLKISGSQIHGNQYVGGLAGNIEGNNALIQGIITSINIISVSTYSGGIAGRMVRGTMVNCGALGNVTSSSSYTGGIVGFVNNPFLSNLYSKGTVAVSGSHGSIGGIVGRLHNEDTMSIVNVYSLGLVVAQGNTTNAGTGGIVGRLTLGGDKVLMKHLYSAAALSENSGSNIGGLVGYTHIDFDYDSIYWDTVATGIQTTANNLGTPLDPAQAQSDLIYKAAGWNFMGSGTVGAFDYWGYNGPTSNQGYPFLFFEEDLVQTGCNVSMAGACFATLKEAFDSINMGSISGDIEIRINHSTIESATAVLTRDLAMSGSTLNIYSGRSGVIISGNINGPIIQFNGTNNATLDGRPMQVGIGANMLVRNNNTGFSATAISITGASSDITVQYVKMECGKGSASNNGVLTIENADNNTAQYNDITGTSFLGGYIGIYLNSGMGNSISYNRIHDFFDRNIGVKGVFIGASETNANIEFNEIYQTDSVTISLSSASYIGIETQSSEGVIIHGNTIRDIVLNGGVTLKGIYVNTSTSLAGMEISGNTIKNLDLYNAGLNEHEVYGIDFNATDLTDSANIYNNFIHDLQSASLLPTTEIYGIRMNGGRAKVYNNIIALGTNQPLGVSLAGIFDASTVAGNQHEIYFNTVYLGGSVTSGANTAALWLNSATPAGRKIYNNIFSNHRTNTDGSAQHFAAYITGTPVLETDYNNYFTNGTGGHLGHYKNTIDNIIDWQVNALLDFNGNFANPDLLMPEGDSIHHFTPQADYVIGLPITGITSDINGISRDGSNPSRGGIEIAVGDYQPNKRRILFGLAFTAADTITATLYPNFAHDTVEYQNLTVVFSMPAGTVTEPAVSYNSIYSGTFPTLVGPGTWNISRQNATIFTGGSTLNLDIYTARINGTFSDGASLTDSIGLFYFRLPGDCNGGNIALVASGDPVFMAAPDSNEVTAIKLENGTRLDTFMYLGNKPEADTLACPLNIAILPDANNDTPTTDEDNPITIDVLANDNFGSDGASNTAIAIVTQATHGTAVVLNKSTSTPTDDQIRYTPFTDFNGTDVFTYRICDANGDCDTASVLVTVNPVDEPFIAVNDEYSFFTSNEDFVLDVLSNDQIGYPIYLFALVAQPTSGGSVIINDNNTPDDKNDDYLVLSPDEDYLGMINFDYVICRFENQIICEQASVFVNINKLDCTTDDITIPEVALQSQRVAAKNNIISSNKVLIGNSVEFFAGKTISLKPGFTVEHGAQFSAIIQNCTSNNSIFPGAEEEINIMQDIYNLPKSKIYPNPFTNLLKIEFLNQVNPKRVFIYDMQGRVIKEIVPSENMNSVWLDLGQINSGIYIVKSIWNDFIDTQKIIKSY